MSRMLEQDTATAVALEELDAIIGIVQGLDDSGWVRQTVCEGWDVAALARHVAAVAWQQSESFHRARLNVTAAPSFLEIAPDRDAIVDGIAAARGHLAAAFGMLGADARRIVPLPFGPLPVVFAVNLVVLEYGLHRHDIERALGLSDDTALRREVAAAIFGFVVGGMLQVFATKRAEAPVAYRLVGESGSTAIEWHGDRWQPGDAHADVVCEITGSDSAIALFATGRIDASDAALVCSEPTLAGSFKQYFPGP